MQNDAVYIFSSKYATEEVRNATKHDLTYTINPIAMNYPCYSIEYAGPHARIFYNGLFVMQKSMESSERIPFNLTTIYEKHPDIKKILALASDIYATQRDAPEQHKSYYCMIS